jgi:predicted secreted protein
MIRAARRSFRALTIAFTLLCAAQAAAAPYAGTSPTTVELSADASRPAANDMAVAGAYFEASDANPAALSKQVNRVIASALEQIHAYPAVRAKVAGTSTFPVYGKDGRKIEAWRMRSDLQLESRDLPALSELLGKLQASLALSGLVMHPAPETRKSTADVAATDAIRAFQARAKTIADTLGKAYRIQRLSIGYGSPPSPIRPAMKSAAFAAEAAAVPIEAGESEIVVTVSGTIELTD